MTTPQQSRAAIAERIIREHGLDQRRIRCPRCAGTGMVTEHERSTTHEGARS